MLRQADSVSPTEEVARPRSPRNEFRPDVEGLRAVSVLAILGFHAEVPGLGGGFVGPDVFFVISGFLITGQLWREVSGTGALRLGRFYGGRARRLLPAAATVGVVTVIASAFLLPPLQANRAVLDGIASALYVPNFWFIAEGAHYFGGHLPPSPFQHYWTLGVEEQFYLLWPILIVGIAWLSRLVRRRPKTAASLPKRPYLVVFALVAATSFALSLVITHVMPAVAYFSLPTRAWDFPVGALVALTAGQWRRLPPRVAVVAGWLGLGAILLACNELTARTPYPGTAALLPVLGAALVIGAGCATPTQGCGRILATAPMRATGRLSYAWYLWHWPMLVLIPAWLGHPVGLAAKLAIVLLSGAIAALTLRFIENPLRFAAPLRRSPLASLAVGGAASALAACVGVALLGAVPVPVGRGAPAAALTIVAAPAPSGSGIDAYDATVQRAFAQAQAAVAASADLRAVPSNLNPPLAGVAAELKAMLLNGCLREPFQSGQPECASGDTASPTTVALVGDSHAAMWNPAFREVATQRHWRLETLAKGACPLADLPITSHLFSGLVERFEHCEQWRGQIISRLRAEHPRLIALSLWRGYGNGNANGWLSGFTSYDPAWIDGLTRLVQQLRATGAQVLVLGPIPDPHTSVPTCLSGHLDDASACAPRRSAAVNQPGIAAEAAATQAGGGQYTDLTELFCTASRCPVIVGNTLVYVDEAHLTLEYSRLLAPAIGALADRALAHG
ncbi:acyltransferase family protein [Mycobacterium palustre]|uniref:acyltransferase family protein n=1 Tax=Mycobacterium palustre TaxID=153971 RepID=UPI003CCB9CFE